jgi:TolA-binding protein
MKPLGTIVASLALLGLFLAPAIAQKPTGSPSPGPEDERMTRMMKMMGDMQQQMGQMQEQMKGMQGMGAMQGRMGQMQSSMHQMRTMMQQHHAEMQQNCAGAGAMAPATPSTPKKSQ